MFDFLRRYIGGNTLLKVTSLNTLAIAIRIVAGLVTSKVVAFYLGAPGMALLGDLRNFLSSVQSISLVGIYNGVVKYTAEFKNDKVVLGRALSTGAVIGAVATVLTSFALFFGAQYWDGLIYPDADHSFIFQLMGAALPFYALNTFLLGLLNGLAKYKNIIYCTIATNVLGLFLTVALVYHYRIDGAFVTVVGLPSLALIFTSISFLRKVGELPRLSIKLFDSGYLKKFASYAGMTLFSSIISPWIFIAIRQYIIDRDGINDAGYWDAMLRLSDFYILFVSTILTLYILPKLAATKSAEGFKREIFNFYKTILPLFALGLIAVYFLKGFIVPLIYTQEFLTMTPIFKWQLAGDFLKVASTVLAYQFIAKNMFWYFIVTQIFSLAIIYGSSIYFVGKYGYVGAGMAHVLSYALYLVLLLFIFRKSLFSSQPELIG